MTRYILLLLVLVAFAGCTKVERVGAPATKVTFTVGSYAAQTKANSYVSLIGETSTFKCKAYLHAVGMETTVQNFFGDDGETITANDETNPTAWLPSHDYYWPKSADSYINFVSWYDKNGAPTTSTETSLVWSGRTIATDDNIMWADEAWHYNLNTSSEVNDELLTDLEEDETGFGQNAVTEGVPTLFHHALAQVKFKVYATPQEADNPATTWKVSISSISLTPIINKGTLTLTNSDLNATGIKAYTGTGANGVPAWTPSTGSTDVISLEGALSQIPKTAVSTATAVEIESMTSTVLPQSLSGMTLTVNYSISTFYGTSTTAHDTENLTAEVAMSSLGTAWEMNKIYTYIIKIDPSTEVITFLPDAKEWETGGTGDLTIE